MVNTRIRANTVTNIGGGFYIQRSSLTIQASQVYSNTAMEGAGFALSDIVNGHIEHTEIYSNNATAYGGGFSNLSSSSPTRTAW